MLTSSSAVTAPNRFVAPLTSSTGFVRPVMTTAAACMLRNLDSRLPRTTSSSTATTITTPVAMYCQLGSIPSRLNPLRMTEMISAPVMALSTLPRPPRKLAPPMITAAIASSSARLPAVGDPALPLPIVSKAATPASMPHAV